MTIEEINEMKIIDIRSLNREDLIDIRNLVIDESMNVSDRVHSFLQQVKNPFTQKFGDYILVVGYDEDSKETIDDKMVCLAKKYSQIII